MISGPHLDLRSVSPVTAVQGEQEQRCAHCGRADAGVYMSWEGVGPLCAGGDGKPDCFRLVLKFGHAADGRCHSCAPYLGDKSIDEQEVAG